MGIITQPARRRPLSAAAVALVAALCPVAGAPAAPPPQTHRPPQPLIIRVDDGGFHWGDAGIGAAAGFGAALVLSGGFVLSGQRDLALRHPPQTKERKQ